MKTAVFVSKFVAGTLLLLGQTTSRADILIDSFQTSQSALGGAFIYNVAAGGGILGGERDFNTFLSFSANGAFPGQLRVAFPEGLLTGRVGGQIVYDGVDNDALSGSFTGLGLVDLTQGGVNDRFRFDITSVTSGSASLTVEVFSPSHGSSLKLNLPHSTGAFDLPFSAFQVEPSRDPIDFHQVGFISISFEMNSGDSVVMNSFITTVPEPSIMALAACVGAGLVARRKMVEG